MDRRPYGNYARNFNFKYESCRNSRRIYAKSIILRMLIKEHMEISTFMSESKGIRQHNTDRRLVHSLWQALIIYNLVCSESCINYHQLLKLQWITLGKGSPATYTNSFKMSYSFLYSVNILLTDLSNITDQVNTYATANYCVALPLWRQNILLLNSTYGTQMWNRDSWLMLKMFWHCE